MTTIITKNGSGAPTAGQLSQGELAVDLTNKELYTKDSGGNVIKVGAQGGSTGTFTDLTATSSFTSPGIDDNATSTAITIDANENVGIGTDTPERLLDASTPDSIIAAFRSTGGASNNRRLEIGSGGGKVGLRSFVDTTDAASDMFFAVGTAEAMRIDADKNISFNGKQNRYLNVTSFDTNSVGAGWDFNATSSNGAVTFSTASTERLRISASGTTTVTGGFEAAQPGAGTNAFAAGLDAGLTSQGLGATAVGRAAGKTSQGTYATAVGFFAGESNQGASAVAVGNKAGNENQGDNTVSVGYWSGSSGQGNNSVAVGVNSGRTTQGDNSVAVGREAGNDTQGASAVAVGRDAGKTTQGARAVAVGIGAGQTNQGTQSVAAGYQAGVTDQGINSVAIGYAAGQSGQGNNSIAVGNGAGASNQAANGITINSSGVAVNSGAPNHIILRSGADKFLTYNGSDKWEFRGGNVTVPNDSLLVGTTSKSSVIGGTVDGQYLGPDGTRYSSDNSTSGKNHNIFYNANGQVGSISTTGSSTSFSTSSDERLKENIVDAPAGNIDSIKVRSFDWKADGQHQEYGFIAQELETVAPYAVSKGETDEDMWGVDYSKLVPMLVKEIQDLKAEVAALKGA